MARVIIEPKSGENYVRWAGEFETLKQLKRDQGDLSEIEVCSWRNISFYMDDGQDFLGVIHVK